MAKKINVTGKHARRIEVSGKPQRRIEPEQFAAALGAEPVGDAHAPNLDPLSLAALGSELIKRPPVKAPTAPAAIPASDTRMPVRRISAARRRGSAHRKAPRRWVVRRATS